MYDIRNLTIWKQETIRQPSKQYLNSDISELNLSVRSYNCLRCAGCRTVGDILSIIEGDENGLRHSPRTAERISPDRQCPPPKPSRILRALSAR